MASIEKRGDSYRITVTNGKDATGKYPREKTTWTPPPGLTARQERAALQEFVVDFERLVKSGKYLCGEKITLAEFVRSQWLPNHAEKNLKPKTYSNYCIVLDQRILPALGHLTIAKIQPMHVIEWLKQLDEAGMKLSTRCIIKPDTLALFKERRLTAGALGLNENTYTTMRKRKPITLKIAQKVADALQKDVPSLFDIAGNAEKLSDTSKSNYFRCLSSVLSTAVQWQVIVDNPCERVKSPKRCERDIVHLEPEEALTLYYAAQDLDDIRIKTALLVLLLTGMRESELAGLEWSDIDYQKKTIRVQRNSQYISGKGIVTGTPKTRSGNRLIAITSDLIDALKAYQAWQAEERLALGDQWQNMNRLFTSWNGQPINNQTIIKWSKQFFRDNGFPAMTVHGLRHTHITMLIAAGVDLRTVSGRAGHARTSITTDIYSHFVKSADEGAAETLFQYFSGQKAAK